LRAIVKLPGCFGVFDGPGKTGSSGFLEEGLEAPVLLFLKIKTKKLV